MNAITREKSKLGFIGVGYMGRPIAQRGALIIDLSTVNPATSPLSLRETGSHADAGPAAYTRVDTDVLFAIVGIGEEESLPIGAIRPLLQVMVFAGSTSRSLSGPVLQADQEGGGADRALRATADQHRAGRGFRGSGPLLAHSSRPGGTHTLSISSGASLTGLEAIPLFSRQR